MRPVRFLLVAFLLVALAPRAQAQPTSSGSPVATTVSDPSKGLAELLARQPSLQLPKEGWLNWITPDLILGGHMEAVGYDTMTRLGVRAVLSLQGELEDDRAWLDRHKIAYKRVPVVDFSAPSADQMREAVDWIRAEVKAGHRVYVHCHGGIGRSATVVAAWLAAENGWTGEQAWEFLRGKRGVIKHTPEQKESLRTFALEELARRSAGLPSPARRTGEKTRTSVRDRVRRTIEALNHPPTEGSGTARGMAEILDRRRLEAERGSRDRVR